DFRKMLDEMGRTIDAVIVATPDHTHAVATAAAMRAGKHVFCEKPLTRLVQESRALRELARQQKVVAAMGNQGTYSGAFRRALELIRNGTLGEIKEVHVWNDGGGMDRKEPPKGSQPVPDYLDWDLWLGPAASRPYHADWMNRNMWRDFGTCQLGNWGSHSANLGFMALNVHKLWLAADAGQTRDQSPLVSPLGACSMGRSCSRRLAAHHDQLVQRSRPRPAGTSRPDCPGCPGKTEGTLEFRGHAGGGYERQPSYHGP
ncbi:MAG: Gfo/Idh/MocA family oxidoreductase, partial [Verrucomicrobia bacterium]|nr:Gfo/Idh/MocA family oxidoreductase [Verrucomicrobiota bacterium]